MNILLIEENKLFQNALKHLILSYSGIKHIYSCQSSAKISKYTRPPIDLVILSIYGLEEHLTEEIHLLQSQYPQAGIIILSERLTKNAYRVMAKYDIYAFLSTRSGPIELESFIIGYDKYNTNLAIRLDNVSKNDLRIEKETTPSETVSFTKRELEVLNLISLELSNIEISKSLGLSIRTIETFRRRMLIKTGSRNMIGVILKAIQFKHLSVNNGL